MPDRECSPPPGFKGINVVNDAPVGGVPEPGGLPQNAANSHDAKIRRARQAANSCWFGPDDIARYRLLGADALVLLEALEQIARIPHNVPTLPSAAQLARQALDG